MRATFTLPSGARVRTQTRRRFVLIIENDSRAWTEKRSDNAGTVESTAAAMRRCSACERKRRGSATSRMYSGDTHTGEIRALP